MGVGEFCEIPQGVTAFKQASGLFKCARGVKPLCKISAKALILQEVQLIMPDNVREPVVQGMFYPANKDDLSKMIAAFLHDAKPSVRDDKGLLGLIAPHAGYVYSGQCAAYAYKLLKLKKFDTIIVLGPSHSTMLNGASVWQNGFYRTSLGDVEIDSEAASFLLDNGRDIEFYPMAHMQEHSIEVQIPFLQYVLKNKFKITPVVLGNQTYEYTKKLADTIYDLIQKKPDKYLIIASTDLSHYHTYDTAKRMDKNVIDLIKKRSLEPLTESIKTGRGEACGIGPVFTLLLLAEKCKTELIDILNVTNSGDVSGDKSRVVGYMSAEIYK